MPGLPKVPPPRRSTWTRTGRSRDCFKRPPWNRLGRASNAREQTPRPPKAAGVFLLLQWVPALAGRGSAGCVTAGRGSGCTRSFRGLAEALPAQVVQGGAPGLQGEEPPGRARQPGGVGGLRQHGEGGGGFHPPQQGLPPGSEAQHPEVGEGGLPVGRGEPQEGPQHQPPNPARG